MRIIRFGVIAFLLLSSCTHREIIVVHPEKRFIGSDKIAKEISSLNSVILITSEEDPELICKVQYYRRIVSPVGYIDLDYSQVEFAGGYFNACLKNAIISWSNNRIGQGGTAIINMKRVYFGQFRTLYQEYKDNYSNDKEFIKYLKTQTFREIDVNIEIKGDWIIIANNPISSK